MKKALLPALIAGIFTMHGAMAADRELLFGPAGLAESVSVEKSPNSTKVEKSVKPSPLLSKPKAQPAVAVAPVKVEPKAQPAVAVAPVKVEPKAQPAVAVAPVKAQALDAPKMPDLPLSLSAVKVEPVSVSAGPDPMSVREQLAGKLRQQVTIGFFPSAIAGSGSAGFLSSFMPLANHLSARTGVLVNFVPERDLKSYGRRITDVLYPVIFINATLAREAMAAGYKPVAVGEEQIAPGYVVKASSKFKKLEDIKDAKIAWSLNAQTSMLAMADVSRLGLTGNTFDDIGAAGRSGVVSALTTGTADVGVWRANEMQKVVDQSNGQLRLLGVGSSAPSSGLWVRSDLVETDFANRLGASLLSMDPDSVDAGAKAASIAYSNGFGLRGRFIAAPQTLTGNLTQLFASAQKAFPASFVAIVEDEAERSSNMARTVTTAVSSVRVADSLAERQVLAAKLKSQVTVGFFPSATGGNGSSAFLSNFMPLANYLSQQTGTLFNFVPERDLTSYGRRIGDVHYPVVFINALLARNAIAAGYVPLVVGQANLAPGFMVLANSPIKKIEEIKNSRVAWSLNAQTSLLTMADVSRLGLTGNTFSDVGATGQLGALSALTSGVADVAVWRSNELEKINDPKFRYLGSGSSAPSSGVWVRKDLAGSDFAKRLEGALLSINPDSADGVVKNVSLTYARGFGLRGEFSPIPAGFISDMSKVVESAKKAFPESFNELVVDEAERDANMARKAIEVIKAK